MTQRSSAMRLSLNEFNALKTEYDSLPKKYNKSESLLSAQTMKCGYLTQELSEIKLKNNENMSVIIDWEIKGSQIDLECDMRDKDLRFKTVVCECKQTINELRLQMTNKSNELMQLKTAKSEQIQSFEHSKAVMTKHTNIVSKQLKDTTNEFNALQSECQKRESESKEFLFGGLYTNVYRV